MLSIDSYLRMLKAKYMFYSTSSCKCQYELIAFFFLILFFWAAKINEEAKSQRNRMTPLKR